MKHGSNLSDNFPQSRVSFQCKSTVDHAIGRHHEIKFQKRERGYEIAIDREHPMSTIDEIRRDAIIAEIELIMSGEQV